MSSTGFSTPGTQPEPLESALPHGTRTEVAGAQHSWDPPAMAELVAAFTADHTRR